MEKVCGRSEVLNASGLPSGPMSRLMISVYWSSPTSRSILVTLGPSRGGISVDWANGPQLGIRAQPFFPASNKPGRGGLFKQLARGPPVHIKLGCGGLAQPWGGLIKRLAHWSVAQAKPGCGVPSQLSDGEASVEASDCFFNQALGGKEVDMSSCELNPVIVPIIEGSTHSEVCGDATDLQADLYPRPATGGALGGTVEHTSLVASVPVLPRALCATPPIKVPRASNRLAASTKNSILSKAMIRKTKLREGELAVGRKATGAKTITKAARCGVIVTECEARNLIVFLNEDW